MHINTGSGPVTVEVGETGHVAVVVGEDKGQAPTLLLTPCEATALAGQLLGTAALALAAGR